jgi:hypothetical protein
MCAPSLFKTGPDAVLPTKKQLFADAHDGDATANPHLQAVFYGYRPILSGDAQIH